MSQIRWWLICAALFAFRADAGTIRAILNQELYTLNVQYSTNGTSFSTGGIGLIQGTRRTGAYNNNTNGAGTEHNTFAPGAAFFSFCVELTEGISMNTTYQFTWSQVSSAPTSAADERAARKFAGGIIYRNVPVLNQMMGKATTAEASLLEGQLSSPSGRSCMKELPRTQSVSAV